jgi:16S rRNA (cytidine1402-2'-O)-methyltransferase
MGRQRSQQTYHNASGSHNNRPRSGTLFIVGLPIGCPEDLTLRARRVLGEVSIVVAEAPLAARALLDYHGIAATITGYGRGEPDRIAIFLDRLKAGHDIALVSDSGMPVIYDPGRLLIAAARASEYQITVVPGPSALTAATALSGASGDRLLFVGQLPRPAQRLDRLFSTLIHERGTTVMFASASSLPRILRRISHILPERRITLAVNMTTPDERVYQGVASDLLARAQDVPQDAEVTLVLSGAEKKRK